MAISEQVRVADEFPAGAAPQSYFTLRSDAAGVITKIGVKIPCEVVHSDSRCTYDSDRHAAYDSLLKALASAGMSIVAVARKDHAHTVEGWLRTAGFAQGRYEIQRAPVSDYNNCDTWARDCLLCASDPQGARALLHPTTNLDGYLATWFSQALGTPLEELNFFLDGGSSLVVDDQIWVVGVEAIEIARDGDGDLSWDAAIQKIAAGTGRTPIIAGIRPQDIPGPLRFLRERLFRIARKRLPPGIEDANRLHRFLATIRSGLSAAVSVARDLLDPNVLYWERSLWSHIDMIVSVTGVSPNGKPILLVAEPTISQYPPLTDDDGEKFDKFTAELNSVVCVLQATDRFEIRRIPAPFADGTVLGYANTIVQKDAVMIPAFSTAEQDFTATDQRNFDIWHVDLQVPTVVQVPGWFAFTGDQGCIRCATLVIDRELESLGATPILQWKNN